MTNKYCPAKNPSFNGVQFTSMTMVTSEVEIALIKKLDFGCGQKKEPDSIGLDGFASPGVDVVHDFDIFPYPF